MITVLALGEGTDQAQVAGEIAASGGISDPLVNVLTFAVYLGIFGSPVFVWLWCAFDDYRTSKRK